MFLAPDKVIAVRNLHQTLINIRVEEASVVLRDVTLRFWPKPGELLNRGLQEAGCMTELIDILSI